MVESMSSSTMPVGLFHAFNVKIDQDQLLISILGYIQFGTIEESTPQEAQSQFEYEL